MGGACLLADLDLIRMNQMALVQRFERIRLRTRLMYAQPHAAERALPKDLPPIQIAPYYLRALPLLQLGVARSDLLLQRLQRPKQSLEVRLAHTHELCDLGGDDGGVRGLVL